MMEYDVTGCLMSSQITWLTSRPWFYITVGNDPKGKC